MLPALRREWYSFAVREQYGARRVAFRRQDAADASEWDAAESAWHPSAGSGSEKELIVLATVQGVVEGCFRAKSARQGMKGQEGGLDLSPDPGSFAEMGEIAGKAVAQIETGSCQTPPEQCLTGGKTRLREKMGMILPGHSGVPATLGEGGKFGSRATQGACAIQNIARTCSGTPQRPSPGGTAQQHDVGQNVLGRGFGGVAARQWNMMDGGKGQKAIQKAVEPWPIRRDLARQG